MASKLRECVIQMKLRSADLNKSQDVQGPNQKLGIWKELQ